MIKIFFTVLTAACMPLLAPLATSALTTQTSVDVSTSGGASAGGSATVTDNSDADAEVRTIMNSGSGGTTYKTEIRTESDGVVHTETEEGTIPASGRADIRIATSSGKHIGRFSGIFESGISSWFKWLFAPNASTSASAENESTSSGSGFFNAQDGFFSAFWKHLRTFFGFF